jgi:hypothetical protein
LASDGSGLLADCDPDFRETLSREKDLRIQFTPLFCGQLTTGPFVAWRVTTKKQMVAKLKAIKLELQRRKHHRTTEVGVWLRKVVLGYYQYQPVPGNTGQLRVFMYRIRRLWRTVLIRRSQRA